MSTATNLNDDEGAERHVALLRDAGCTCPRPLLGYRPEVGPRCRLCNRVAAENGRSEP